RFALSMGAVASVGAVGSAYAQNAAQPEQKSQSLETIVVTGSNIRRVDIETANPVLTIDHAAIQKSGKLTVGDLVQALPSMAGAEFGADYGITDRDDGQRKPYHAMFGQSTDKGSIMLGLNYNKSDAVSAANRAYSHDALYKYSTGYVVHGGSSRTPNGRINLPKGNPVRNALGCSSVTRLPGTVGNKPTDYRCYKSSTDAFNYQAVGNYDQTPSERTGLFALGNYKLTDNVEAFAEAFHNKTVSRSQIAPVPLDTQTDGMVIPSNQYYNPFGTEFSINGYAANGS